MKRTAKIIMLTIFMFLSTMAVNAETLNDFGFVLNKGCNDYTDISIQDVSSRIDQEVETINLTFSEAFEAIYSVSKDTEPEKIPPE